MGGVGAQRRFAITGALTTRGPVAADVFVLAALARTPGLAGELGVKTPINVVSGTLAHSAHPRSACTAC